MGRVEIGSDALIGPEAVIRGDGHFVRIGDDFAIGEASTVHIAHSVLPAIIGDGVSVGRNAVVHACTVGDNCVIEDDVVVLDGSLVGNNVVIEKGSTVFPRSNLEEGFLYAGSPAKAIGRITDEVRKPRAARIREEIAALMEGSSDAGGEAHADGVREALFVARGVRFKGRVDLAPRSSVFFACHLEAERGAILVGENTNIQDNTRIFCDGDGVEIGADTTLGHNVRMRDCRVGARALIGIGAFIDRGTVVEDEVMVAAGATTVPGQRLERGWVWGGRPARQLSKLDDAKRQMMLGIIEHYCGYAETYRRIQEQAFAGDAALPPVLAVQRVRQ